jgi:hypothetical protein
MCVVLHCECVGYRQHVPGQTAPTRQASLWDLLAAGRASARPRARKLADQIQTSISDLFRELRDERAQAPIGEAAKPAASRKRPAPKTCPHCDRVCASGTGLSAHVRNAHGDAGEPVDCPDCGRPVSKQGLGGHRFYAHGVTRAEAS